MSPKRKSQFIIILTGIFFVTVLLWWLVKDFPVPIAARVPGMDNRPKMTIRSDSVVIGEFLRYPG